jgi:hypothetical protein
VANNHPVVVARLKALAARMDEQIGGSNPKARRPPGTVANPKTLYPTDEPPKPMNKDSTDAKPAELDRLKPGDAVRSESAPQIGGKAFTLTCQVETELRNTILVAHGGTAAGYALYLNDGRVVFSVRTGAKDAIAEVQSGPIRGPVRIKASLAQDGSLTLTVSDQPTVTGKAAGLIPRQPQEDFCLGHDNGEPVARYPTVEPFKGTITDLKVTTP